MDEVYLWTPAPTPPTPPWYKHCCHIAVLFLPCVLCRVSMSTGSWSSGHTVTPLGSDLECEEAGQGLGETCEVGSGGLRRCGRHKAEGRRSGRRGGGVSSYAFEQLITIPATIGQEHQSLPRINLRDHCAFCGRQQRARLWSVFCVITKFACVSLEIFFSS